MVGDGQTVEAVREGEEGSGVEAREEEGQVELCVEAEVGGEVEEAVFRFGGNGHFGGDGAAFELGLRVTETGTGNGSLLFAVSMSFSWRTQEVSLSGSFSARTAAGKSSLSIWEAESESPGSRS